MIGIREKNTEAFSTRYGRELLADTGKASGIQQKEEQYEMIIQAGKVNVIFELPDIIRLCYVVGIGDGSFLRRLLEKLPEDAQLIVYEPDKDLFCYICEHYDISDLIMQKQVRMVIGDRGELRSISEALTTIVNMHTRGMVITPGYQNGYTEDCQYLEAIIRDFRDTWVFRTGRECKNELFAVAHLEQNYLAKSVFESIPTRDIPVILVAAGPSLKKNLHLLAGMQDRAIIIAVSHTAKYLEQNGVRAHFFAETDPKMGNPFLQLDQREKLRFLMKPCAASDKQELCKGHCYYYGFDSEALRLVKDSIGDDDYNCGGSVATDTFDFVASLGFKTVILVGQDLAYDREGHTHVDQEEAPPAFADTDTIDIYGQPIKTRTDWMIYLRSYERLIGLYPEVRVIDATEGGARIEGTEIKTLQESLDEYCDVQYPVDQWLDNSESIGDLYGEGIAKQILTKLFLDTQEVYQLVKDALLWRERMDAAESGGTDSEWFMTVLNKYDICFQKILDSEKNGLLFYYCGNDVKEFISRYSQIDKNGNYLERRLVLEKNLLNKLAEQGALLVQYMEELL